MMWLYQMPNLGCQQEFREQCTKMDLLLLVEVDNP